MNMHLKSVIALGWPVLSVLFLFSIISLAIFLQCWFLLGRSRRMAAYATAQAERQRLIGALDLVEKRLAVLGTIANAAPFVGLLGTVIGIIRAFHSISLNSAGGISTVAGGISEALISTAAGLAVAIPASMLYNYFSYHQQRIAKDAGID